MSQSLNQQECSGSVFYSSADFLNAEEERSVFHGFFGRQGGVSKGLYTKLNCGEGSGDDMSSVQKNREIVARNVGCDADKLLSLYQVHGNHCVVIDKLWSREEKPKADSFVTDKAGIALGILTADCAPVLFYGEKANGEPVIGAAHAGWGGAFKGVLQETTETMMSLGAIQESIRAVVGPCISKASYEVSYDFADNFMEEDEENERFFTAARRDGHLMFDLAGYCAFKLYKAGVKSISLMDMDTYSDEQNFFSYRRTTHREEPDYGRQISVIMIKSD